jgi:hypothetical protein
MTSHLSKRVGIELDFLGTTMIQTTQDKEKWDCVQSIPDHLFQSHLYQLHQ